MTGYLHFGSGSEPRQTFSVPFRFVAPPASDQRAYGYKVLWEGRWWRVRKGGVIGKSLARFTLV